MSSTKIKYIWCNCWENFIFESSQVRFRRISDRIGGRIGWGGGGGGTSIIINIELHHGDFIFLQSREGVRVSGVGSLRSDGCPPPGGIRRIVHQRLPLVSQTQTSPGLVVTVDGDVQTGGNKPSDRRLRGRVGGLDPLVDGGNLRVDQLEVELTLSVPELLDVHQSGEQRLGLVVRIPAESIRRVVKESVLGVVGEDLPPAYSESGRAAAALTSRGTDGILHHQIVI